MWHSAAAVAARHRARILVVLTHWSIVQVSCWAVVCVAAAWAANKSRSPVEHAAAGNVVIIIAGSAGRAARAPTAGRHSVVRLRHNGTSGKPVLQQTLNAYAAELTAIKCAFQFRRDNNWCLKTETMSGSRSGSCLARGRACCRGRSRAHSW